MARQIKETPVLKGKYAREFDKKVKENRDKKVSEQDRKRAMDAYNKIKVVG